jgi:glucose-1-phosphate thymidylyltransferase
LLHRVSDPSRFGVAEFDASGQVVGFEEKPEHPRSDSIPIGVYFFRPGVFPVIAGLLPSGRGELEITDVLNHYIRSGELFWRHYEGSWTDAGTIESLLRAGIMAAEPTPDPLVEPVAGSTP